VTILPLTGPLRNGLHDYSDEGQRWQISLEIFFATVQQEMKLQEVSSNFVLDDFQVRQDETQVL
jgi:hypothetical protein